jgi:hypothetical protein
LRFVCESRDAAGELFHEASIAQTLQTLPAFGLGDVT